jgi:hypothetical protein
MGVLGAEMHASSHASASQLAGSISHAENAEFAEDSDRYPETGWLKSGIHSANRPANPSHARPLTEHPAQNASGARDLLSFARGSRGRLAQHLVRNAFSYARTLEVPVGTSKSVEFCAP